MKYDMLDKVECTSYPNDNVVRENKKRRFSLKRRDVKRLDVAVAATSVVAAASVVMLMSSIVTMAVSGVLTQVFAAL